MQQVIRVLKTPITMILLLALLGFGAKWGYDQVTKTPPAKPGESCVPTDVGKTLTPDKVTVRVLNGGELGGYAKKVAFNLRAAGFHVIAWTNADREVDHPVIVGNAADDPEVKLVAQYFTGATTEGDGRSDHVVDVILSSQKTFRTDVKGSVPVSGTVCLPKIGASPEPTTGLETPTVSVSPITPSPSK